MNFSVNHSNVRVTEMGQKAASSMEADVLGIGVMTAVR
jgi:hypothetical protein